MAGPSSAPTAAPEPEAQGPSGPIRPNDPERLSDPERLTDAGRLKGPIQLVARRFAEVVCPPEVRAGQRTDRVLREVGLMLAALAPTARTALAGALILLDQGARLYPPARGRRFARLEDGVAEAYLRALLARHDAGAELVQRLKSVVTMCYYDLPEVQREIGYDPAPYIAAVSRRRLESYGPQIRAGEAAVTASETPGQPGLRPAHENPPDMGPERS